MKIPFKRLSAAFFLLISAVAIVMGENDSFTLKQRLTQRIERLIIEEFISGSVSIDSSGWTGVITVNEQKGKDVGITCPASIFFTGDSLEGMINLRFYNNDIPVIFNASLSDDEINGVAIINTPRAACEADFFVGVDDAGSLKGKMTVDFTKFRLRGSLPQIRQEFESFLHDIHDFAGILGFQRLQIRAVGEKSLEYLSECLEYAASFEINSPNNGIITGRVNIEEGNFYYMGQPFIIQRGIYDFTQDCFSLKAARKQKAYITQPQGGAVLTTYFLTIEYDGVDERAAVEKIYSEPCLTVEEIQRLLVRGSPFTPEVSGQVASNLENQIEIAIAQYDSRRVTAFAELQVGRLLAFDRVVIENGLFSSKNRFIADKDLTSRLKLTVRGTVGSSAKGSIAFDYRLYPHIYLTNETDRLSETGVDLRYIIRFW